MEDLKVDVDRVQKDLAYLAARIMPKDETPRRFIALLVATLTCFGITLASVLLVPAGLSTPPPNWAIPGVAGLYVWSHPSCIQDGKLCDADISLAVRVDQTSPEIEYVATFPRAQAGNKFVIALSGSAVLQDLDSDAGNLVNEYPKCVHEQPNGDQRPGVCQVIMGTISSNSDTSAHECRGEGVQDSDTVSVRLTGKALVHNPYDWAHQITSLPYLGNQPNRGTGSVEDLVYGAFGDNFSQTDLTTCYSVMLDHTLMDYTPNIPPTRHIGDFMEWDPASNVSGYRIVSTERSAQWKTNILLVAIGIFAPAFITLLSMSLRSYSRLHSQSRERSADIEQ